MEKLTSRKNAYITHIRRLASESEYRRESGEFVCDGLKLLKEATAAGRTITSVLWKDEPDVEFSDLCYRQFCAADELFDYASPLKNSPGPIFTVKIEPPGEKPIKNAIVLENVQDPGNVGTVIRTANAFNIGAVILTGSCAGVYNPKTVRATMGAIFRQRISVMTTDELKTLLTAEGLPLYGAVLSATAVSINSLGLRNAAVAIGSEGRGLSTEFRAICDGELIIPMESNSESLNAAAAATVFMWEMYEGNNG